MSLVEQMNIERQARLIRLGRPTYKAEYNPPPIPDIIETLAWNAGCESMWFHDLVSLRAKPPSQISVKHIQAAVAEYYGVQVSDILSHRRTRDIVTPRHLAMFLTKKLTHRSLPEIGRLFGRRDHTTVLHAVRKIEALCETDSVIFGVVTKLRRRFI